MKSTFLVGKITPKGDIDVRFYKGEGPPLFPYGYRYTLRDIVFRRDEHTKDTVFSPKKHQTLVEVIDLNEDNEDIINYEFTSDDECRKKLGRSWFALIDEFWDVHHDDMMYDVDNAIQMGDYTEVEI